MRVWRGKSLIFSRKEKLVMLGVVAAALLIAGGAKALLGGTPAPLASGDIELQRGLVGWWKLDGNGKDATPYGDNGNPAGGPSSTSDRHGLTAGAMAFNGTSQYYSVPNVSTLQVTGSQTVSAWVYPTSFSVRRNPYGKAYGGEGTITQETNGTLNYYYGTAGANNTPYTQCGSTTALSLNTWSSITLVRDLSALTLTWYINGQQTNQCTAAYAAATASTNPVTIGHDYAGYYSGSIDDVREYNRALSAAEAGALHDEYNPGLAAASGQNGLVGWWKMDGNAKDSSPYSDNASANTGVLAADREGAANKAYSFNGTSQCMTLPNTSNINIDTVSVSVWINTTQVPASDADFVEKWAGSGSYPYVMRIQSNGHPSIRAYDGTTNPSVTATVAVNDGHWHHIVGTRTFHGPMQIYVDGVSVGSGTDTTTGTTTNSSALFVGCRGGPSQLFNGSIDDLRVYNRVISSSEVTNLYKSYDSQVSLYGGSGAGGSGLGQGLLGYWAFNGNAKDSTPYGNNGTVTGATLAADREGRANSAYLIGETSTYINIGSPSTFANLSSSGFTYSIWLMRTGSSTYHWPEIMGAGNTHIYYGIRSGNFGDNIYFEWGTSPYAGATYAGTSGHSLPINEWHMMTVTYDATSSTLKAFWDGSNFSTSTSVTPDPTFGGLSFTTTVNGWPGTIDDARVWGRPLSATEVAQLYNTYN